MKKHQRHPEAKGGRAVCVCVSVHFSFKCGCVAVKDGVQQESQQRDAIKGRRTNEAPLETQQLIKTQGLGGLGGAGGIQVCVWWWWWVIMESCVNVCQGWFVLFFF